MPKIDKTEDKSLVEAWQILRKTVYNGKDIRDGAESIVTGRPTFDSTTIWTRTRLNYRQKSFYLLGIYLLKLLKKE
jgi:alpha-N-acetylglucosaminidase